MSGIHPKSTYLGDGVYAHMDEHVGGQVWLQTQRENGVHEIALETEVFWALIQLVTAAGWRIKLRETAPE